MKRKSIIAILSIAVLLVFVIVRLNNNKNKFEERIFRFDENTPVTVKTETVSLSTYVDKNTLSGTFEPNRETKVSAEMQGKINEIYVDAGSFVKQGQKLIQLDNKLLKLQLEGVNIQISSLKKDVERYKVLSEADAIQGIQLEKTTTAYAAALVQKATLEEQIKKTAILAPFAGMVTSKMTEVGAFAAPGVPLLQITDISKLKFNVNVAEKQLVKFKEEESYKLIADAYPNEQLVGQVVMIGSKSNMGNAFPVQILVNNTRDLKIKSGMFGRMSMESGKNPIEKIIIPSSAIIGSDIKPQVYVAKDNKAVLQDIVIDERNTSQVVVSKGLSVGDKLIIGGFINLYDGAKIQIN